MQEIDAVTVNKSRVVVDSRQACLAEAGDIIIPQAKIDAELGEIINGVFDYILETLAISGNFCKDGSGQKNNQVLAKKYVLPGEAARIKGVCDRTLRYWEEQGKIKTIRTAGGQRRYDITTYTTGTPGNRTIILYARVSSPKQKENLQRQCEYLQSRYPQGEIVKEVGVRLNL